VNAPLDGGEAKYEVRVTSYGRQQKDKTHRNAVSTSCELLTVHGGVSPASTSTQLQVCYLHCCVQLRNRLLTFVEKYFCLQL